MDIRAPLERIRRVDGEKLRGLVGEIQPVVGLVGVDLDAVAGVKRVLAIIDIYAVSYTQLMFRKYYIYITL